MGSGKGKARRAKAGVPVGANSMRYQCDNFPANLLAVGGEVTLVCVCEPPLHTREGRVGVFKDTEDESLVVVHAWGAIGEKMEWRVGDGHSAEDDLVARRLQSEAVASEANKLVKGPSFKGYDSVSAQTGFDSDDIWNELQTLPSARKNSRDPQQVLADSLQKVTF
jgi:hypothetical protein